MKLLAALRTLGIMVLGLIVFLVVISIVQFPLRQAHVSEAVGAVVVGAVALAIYVGWVRFVERRAVTELAPRALIPETLLGIVVGLALFSTAIGLLALADVFVVHGYGGWNGLAAGALSMLLVAVTEEILFRGFVFRTIRTVAGTWIGVAVSAVAFGLFHAFNPGASVLSTVAIALEAGVLLALAYAATNRLWLPIGLHAGWNFAEGFVFGTPISGTMPSHARLYGELHGPLVMTGGAFGLEASIAAVGVCLLASCGFGIWVARRESNVATFASGTAPPSATGRILP
ncbi:MAG: CPBP family intramembrane metalloprotease [Candidatus Eremiobacteraeota bacterium]|nr:CPBP family intramembrane metalloprotease [Candidatus Eremiobacteraeota bacterium]